MTSHVYRVRSESAVAACVEMTLYVNFKLDRENLLAASYTIFGFNRHGCIPQEYYPSDWVSARFGDKRIDSR